MNKTILRYLVIALIAIALGVIIYHLNQPTGIASFGPGVNEAGGFSGGFGGGHDFGEAGSSLIGGLSGVAKNLLQVGIVTAAVVLVRKMLSMFRRQQQPDRAR
jgi:hypothetical protein